MRFHMNHFWDIMDWLSELPEDEYDTVIYTKGDFFIVKSEDQTMLNFICLRWGHLLDTRAE